MERRTFLPTFRTAVAGVFEAMDNPRILIVGHGYLGAALAEEVDRRRLAEVVAMHRGADSAGGVCSLLSGDVSSRESLAAVVERAFPAPPDFVVHCASSGRGGADAYRAVFVDGLRNLAALLPGTPVLFTGSTSVYGQTDGSTVDETSETAPDRETGRLLVEAESIAREGGGVALRLAGIYGPARSVHLRRLLDGSATIEDADPSRYLNQIHRDDAVGAIVHLLGLGEGFPRGGVFNVVDDTAITQRECYETLAARFGLPVPPLAPPDPGRKRGWTHKIVSNAALRELGWEPGYPSFFDAVERDERLVPSIREGIAAAG